MESKPGLDEVIAKKAEIIAEGEEITPEILQKAEEEVGRMEGELGSLSAVVGFLDLEMELEGSGLEERYPEAYDQAMSSFNLELMNFLKNYGLQIGQLAQTEPQEAQLVVENIFSRLFFSVRAACLRNLEESGLVDMARVAKLLALQERISRSVLKKSFDLFLTAAPDAPPPPAGHPNQQAEELTRLKTIYKVFSMALAGDGKEPPPPYVPNGMDGTEEYEKVIPTEIENVYWDENQEFGLEFELRHSWRDPEGRVRNFFAGELIDKRDGKNIRLDLSKYIGSTVLFEGTAGTIIAAHKDIKFSGAARDMIAQLNYYAVALNVESMKRSPKFMETIFHELGHCYIFANQLDQKIFAPKKPGGFFFALPNRNQPERPRGIEWYREAIKELPNQLAHRRLEIEAEKSQIEGRGLQRQGRGLPGRWATVELNGRPIPTFEIHLSEEEEARLNEINDEIDQIAAFGKYSLGAANNRQSYYRASGHPKVDVVRSIFHERNACAFAIHQMRKLMKTVDFSPLTDKDLLKRTRGVMEFYSDLREDDRYVEGIAKK